MVIHLLKSKKLTNLGCPPSSHVIDREINTKVVLLCLSSFKSSPMLSVLLSVEELELLVIPYCHVFENHLHFLSLWLICPSTSSSYHQAMVPILHHIVITNFHPVLCRCLIFHSFSFTSRTEHVPKHPSKLNFMKLSFQRAIVRMKRVPNKRVVPILLRRCNCPRLISDCATLNVFAISPCTGLQNWWFLMNWKEGLKDLLNIKFFPFYISEHVLKSWWKHQLPSQAL
jgi:hypothetical protein